MKRILIIGGSDSLAAAGIQQDLRAAQHHNVHAATVITAVTAQNHEYCAEVVPVKDSLIQSQLEAVASASEFAAIKIGMIVDSKSLRAIVPFVKNFSGTVIYDPVGGASSGGWAMSTQLIEDIKKLLLPHIDLLTPNLPELAAFTGKQIKDRTDWREACEDLLKHDLKAVLVKGGHDSSEQPDITDYYYSIDRKAWLNHSKIAGEFRGTGCYLATSIACASAEGHAMKDAVVFGQAALLESLASAVQIGEKKILHSKRQSHQTNNDTQSQKDFIGAPQLKKSIGVYPVLSSYAWLERLVPKGIQTVQLRIKNEPLDSIEEQIVKSIHLCEKYDCQLFINDYWQLAIKHRAYGVHLGQEDLDSADIAAIYESRLRLGISTHSESELSRALKFLPSYVALGPIFETTCKSMKFGPQGLAKIKRWQKMSPCPLVAIGGLKHEHIMPAVQNGANGVAVISALTEAKNPELETEKWLNQYTSSLSQEIL